MRRLLVVLLLVAALAGGLWFWEGANFTAPGPSQGQTVVLIAPGEGTAIIARKLEKAGAISSATLFRAGVRLRGLQSQLKAGEFALPAHASMEEVARIIAEGKSIQHKITVAEGLTSQMIYDIVKNDPVLEGDAGPVPDEGTLLPETYLFTRGVTRAEMLARMKKAQDDLWEKLWPGRAANLPYSTRMQVITLASIVEKETGVPRERAHIAGVFVNRLRQGIKLQSDPTIIYTLTKGYPLGRGIRASELAKVTPYNTYAITGLPPTPICNPGRDAIAAVINPADTKDIFFVANGTGGHAFSSTMSEHEKNVSNWRKIEQGEKTQNLSPAKPRK